MFDVKQDFSAVGDGVTDDTNAIQAAFNAASAAGGTVYFPPTTGRTYLVSQAAGLSLTGTGVTVLLNGQTLRFDNRSTTPGGLTVSGPRCTIDLGGGTIDGGLRTAVLTAQTNAGGSVHTVADVTSLAVGDVLQSSYGLGSDGSNPIAITAINTGTKQITTAASAAQALPVGAVLGNWVWNATVTFTSAAAGGRICNGRIRRSKGYALNVGGRVDVEAIEVSENGLDIVQLTGTERVRFLRCRFLNILDAAKQGIAVTGGAPIVECDQCHFARDNSDPDFFLMAAPKSVECVDCTFDGANTHPAPYDTPAFTSLHLTVPAGATIGAIEVASSTYVNYGQPILMTSNGNMTAFGVDRIRFRDCAISTPFARLESVTCPSFTVRGCQFSSTATTSTHYFTNYGTVHTSYQDCDFIGDLTIKDWAGTVLEHCTFSSCSQLRVESTSLINRCLLKSTALLAWPTWDPTPLRGDDLVIDDPTLTTAANLDGIVYLPANNQGRGLSFRSAKGTLKGIIYNQNFHSFYFYDAIVLVNGVLAGLLGDDWYIPFGSRVWDTNGPPTRVNKSTRTALTASAAAGATSLPVASPAGIASGDRINILLTNGSVHSTTVNGAPAGSTVVIASGLPSPASSGANVCSFTAV